MLLAASSGDSEESEGGSGNLGRQKTMYSGKDVESSSCMRRLNRLTNSYDYIMFYTSMCATSGWCS